MIHLVIGVCLLALLAADLGWRWRRSKRDHLWRESVVLTLDQVARQTRPMPRYSGKAAGRAGRIFRRGKLKARGRWRRRRNGTTARG